MKVECLARLDDLERMHHQCEFTIPEEMIIGLGTPSVVALAFEERLGHQEPARPHRAQNVGHAVAVNPDSELARVAREEGWEILRFERLNRRLRYAGALVGAAALGGAGSLVARRVAA